ncbi:SPRY domain-containing protein 3-like [Heptranchias perlo]|uniref:SPRY domain-containing protein 3-like n=1 Tax=Heptranchias perlo TaxID=212740 RepID=UPI00355A4141
METSAEALWPRVKSMPHLLGQRPSYFHTKKESIVIAFKLRSKMDDFNRHVRELLSWKRGVRRSVATPAAHDRFERVQVSGDVLRYQGNSGDVGCYVGCYVASQPLPKYNNYFEVLITDSGVRGSIAVGVVPYDYNLSQQLGWVSCSAAFHADDGKLYSGRGVGQQVAPKCHSGDRIGCGSREDSTGQDPQKAASLFFTRNGKEIGSVVIALALDSLHPAVGMHSIGEEVQLDLLAEWGLEDEDSLMVVDNHEDDWARLHDMKVSGSVLEYAGKGKSIMDVGLAQAKQPLSTRSHYFEVEIVNPGEKCYIAVGVARKDYPKQRHPGWNRGSVAYHADDGKIFYGSGVGHPFGPRCYKGDIMGCGIMFPRDFRLDSEGECDNDGKENLEGCKGKVRQLKGAILYYTDSDEEEEEEEECGESQHQSKKVVVFFSRNGKIIGKKESWIPLGGFFPTIGMLSLEEKVKVDFRPLSG